MKFATIASSSSGNCIFVKADNTRLLIDAGISANRIAKGLNNLGEDVRKIDAILITHEHADHIKGIATLCKKYMIPVYASPKTMPQINADIPTYLQNIYEYNQQIGAINIEYFKISHDAIQPVGMKFTHNEKTLGLMTDTGKITHSIVNALKNLDAYILEANHSLNMLKNGPYPQFLKNRVASEVGHLSNHQTAELITHIIEKENTPILLAHLSERNNTPNTALCEVKDELNRLNFKYEINLEVAPAQEQSKIYEI